MYISIFKYTGKYWRVALVATLFFFFIENSYALRDTSLINKIIETEGKILDELQITEKNLRNEIYAAIEIYKKQNLLKNIYPTIRIWYTFGMKNNQGQDQISKNMLRSLSDNKIIDRTSIAKCYHFISWLFASKGFVRIGEHYGNLAQEYYNPKQDSIELGKVLSNLCVSHIQTRDYNQAKYLGKLSIPYNKEPYFIAAALSNLGLAYIYSNEEVYKGRFYLEKARDIYDIDAKNFYYNISKSYEAEGDFVCALLYADSAALIKTESNYENFYAFTQKGICHYHLGNYNKAKSFLKKAYVFKDSIVDIRERAKLNLALAQTEYKLKIYDEAIKYLHEGLHWIGPVATDADLKKAGITFLPSGDLYYINYLHELAKTYSIMPNSGKTNNKNYTKTAKEYYEKCISFIDKMKLFYNSPKAKNDLARETKEIYADYIELITAQENSLSDIKVAEFAFRIAQQYNAFYLREQLSERNALEKFVHDNSLIDRYYRYKSYYIDFITMANENPTSFPEYLSAKNKFESFKDSIQKANPGFKKYASGFKLVTLKEIQNKLKSDEHFLHYFFGNNQLFIFSISKKSIEVKRLKNAEIIKTNVKFLLATLAEEPQHKLDSLSQQKFNDISIFLYQNLIKNVEIQPEIKKLVIVPDDILHRMPFEALQTEPHSGRHSKKAYLIHKYACQYLYFCGQLFLKQKDSKKDELLGFGLEYDRYTLESMNEFIKDSISVWLDEGFRGETLAPLYFSDDEVETISKLFKGRIFLNEKALKSNFYKYGQDCGLLHVSAHSYVDFNRPELSGIIFTKTNKEANHLLTVEDISKMNFSAQLVTLSSCNSSTGRISDGSGVSSLTKVFIENGCDAVLGSQWTVSDQVTSIFMERFYIHLKNGMEKSAALRAAKLDIIEDEFEYVTPQFKNPFYWASWTIYGDDTPIQEFSSWKLYFIYFLLMSVFGIALLYMIRNKNKKLL